VLAASDADTVTSKELVEKLGIRWKVIHRAVALGDLEDKYIGALGWAYFESGAVFRRVSK
jgi:hypothetical protein